jgi:hypothetical protein
MPSIFMVTSFALHIALEISMCYPHRVPSAPQFRGELPLDMGNSWNVTIHVDYWRAQIEEENRWQIKTSL